MVTTSVFAECNSGNSFHWVDELNNYTCKMFRFKHVNVMTWFRAKKDQKSKVTMSHIMLTSNPKYYIKREYWQIIYLQIVRKVGYRFRNPCRTIMFLFLLHRYRLCTTCTCTTLVLNCFAYYLNAVLNYTFHACWYSLRCSYKYPLLHLLLHVTSWLIHC